MPADRVPPARPHLWRAGSAVAFAGTVLLWMWLAGQRLSPALAALLTVGAPVLVVPVSVAGRRILDLAPTPERTPKVTAVFHACVILLLGVAVVVAVDTAGRWRGLVVPIPHAVGAFLFYATGAAALLTVLNLALRGLGAPFAVALSRRLATDWLYARTRNPMVLASLAWLFAAGLWFQSALFLLWHLVIVTPALLFMVKEYEERELEIRFGEPYRRYRAATPFLWPSLRPRARPSGGTP